MLCSGLKSKSACHHFFQVTMAMLNMGEFATGAKINNALITKGYSKESAAIAGAPLVVLHALFLLHARMDYTNVKVHCCLGAAVRQSRSLMHASVQRASHRNMRKQDAPECIAMRLRRCPGLAGQPQIVR